MKLAKNISITLICVILGVILSWQFQSVSNNKEVATLENKRLEEYREELLMEKNTNQLLRDKIEQLQNEINSYQTAQGNIDEQNNLLQTALLQAKMIAGLVDVKGKGLIITLNNGIDTIRESDILKILNELRACDVQAISINNERIVAMSEIRSAGGYFIINGRQVLPPIEIKVIADPSNVEYALNMTGGVLKSLEMYLDIKVKTSDEVIIPKVRDDGTVINTSLLTPVESK